jgi:phenylacetate-CoA ligase
VVSGGYFIHLIGSAYDSGVVRRFQVIQRQYDHIEIRLVVANASELNTSWLEERVRAAMGPECRVTWTFVDDIPPLASGKYEYTRTEI